jgi:histidinol-phosphate phosphatase family protein
MKNKAIFLDRDGTINVDKNYIYKAEDLEIIPHVVEGLKLLKQAGYKLIIVTNQSGIGRGYYTAEDYINFRNELLKRLNKRGVFLSGDYRCPHIEEDNCNCRKPKTGMLEEAARDFNLDLKECWMIGDSLSDIQAGKNAGCRTIHVLTGEHEPISYADFVAINMIEAANYILNFEHNNK